MIDFLKEAVSVVPSQRQLDWFDVGFYAFIHFGVNTFTDREWGLGDEPEEIFDPRKLDCDQWVEAVKSAGMKGLILTAKHHDGFCLWPSKYTEHSVKNSPCKRDVVKEAAEACKRGGIKFGVYLSPWDRNCELYGTDAYNDYYCNQLTELLTGYGDLFCVWFDGACGEGPNGKKQVYDFDRYFELVRKYQPGAVCFGGPDTIWCGNEEGVGRECEWSVKPVEVAGLSEVQTGPGPLYGRGDMTHVNAMSQNTGELSMILFSKGLTFTPSEIDTSIRPGWFWHEQEELRSLEDLFRVYVGSVGGNCCLNLNIPPNRDGLLDERDVKRLKELGELIQDRFGTEVPVKLVDRSKGDSIQREYEIVFEEPYNAIRTLVLEEDLTHGQRIESFEVFWHKEGYGPLPIYQGHTVGNKKICLLHDPHGRSPVVFDKEKNPDEHLFFKITAARDTVYLKNVTVYK